MTCPHSEVTTKQIIITAIVLGGLSLLATFFWN